LLTRLLGDCSGIVHDFLFWRKQAWRSLGIEPGDIEYATWICSDSVDSFYFKQKTDGRLYALVLWIKIAAWITAAIIVSLNIKLVIEEVSSLFSILGDEYIAVKLLIFVVLIFVTVLLLYIIFEPIIERNRKIKNSIPHGEAITLESIGKLSYNQIAITVDFSKNDANTIQHALSLGGTSASYLLIHIVESAGAIRLGEQIMDNETLYDLKNLQKYQSDLQRLGYKTQIELGYGKSANVISNLVNKSEADLLVMGAHGHKGIKDIIFGSTVDAVRHNVKIPVLIVK
jgi:manganese transport protein